MKVCMIVSSLINNGISAVIENYCRALRRDGVEVELIAGGEVDSDIAEVLKKNGIDTVRIANKDKAPWAYYGALRTKLKTNSYDLVHIHCNSGMSAFEVLTAKLSCDAKIVCHCHSCGTDHPYFHKVLRRLASKMSDLHLACSDEAGRWLFAKDDFTVLYNAFDIRRFVFDEGHRMKVRDELGIPCNALIFGSVGRVNKGKNQEFTLQVFEHVHKEINNSFLIFAGDGPDMHRLHAMVNSSKAGNNVIVLGDVEDSSCLYSAFDCFLFPSLFEGLGIAAIEAQLAGCPVFASSGVPSEAELTDKFYRFDLSSGSEVWAKRIVEYMQNREVNRAVDLNDFKDYDIELQGSRLTKLYCGLNGGS